MSVFDIRFLASAGQQANFGVASRQDSENGKSAKELEARFKARVQVLKGFVTNQLAAAKNAVSQTGAIERLESAAREVGASLTQMGAELQAMGMNSSELASILGELDQLNDQVSQEIQNTQPREWEQALAQESYGSKLPLDQLEKVVKGMNREISGIVGIRIHLARVAVTLGLVDHAVHMLQKAYGDVRFLLEFIIGSLNGREPTTGIQEVLANLRMIKDKVLIGMKNALGSHGGPSLTLEEVEALMMKESDLEPGKSPVAQKILKNFNIIQNKDQLQRHTISAVVKLAESLPNLLIGVMNNLKQIQQDENAGVGSALINVNQSLSRLELAKGILRILAGGENSFKDKAVSKLNLGMFEGMIEKLEILAETVFKELETRGFIRSRTVEDPKKPDLEGLKDPNQKKEQSEQEKNPVNPRTDKPEQNPMVLLGKLEMNGLNGSQGNASALGAGGLRIGTGGFSLDG